MSTLDIFRLKSIFYQLAQVKQLRPSQYRWVMFSVAFVSFVSPPLHLSCYPNLLLQPSTNRVHPSLTNGARRKEKDTQPQHPYQTNLELKAMPPLSPSLSSTFLLLLLFRYLSITEAAHLNLNLNPVTRRTCPVILTAPSTTARIVGASPATTSLQSHLVSLSHPNNSFACTATLISRNWALTAAHCGVTTSWQARLHASHAHSNERPSHSIQSVHSFINSTASARLDTPGDIALLRLNPSTSKQLFKPILINTIHSVPNAGAFARAAGYGRTDDAVPAQPAAANMVDAPVNHPKKCESVYESVHNVSEINFICAGYDRSRCRADACNGDSGGPLLQYSEEDSNMPVLIGVSSFGLECGRSAVPGVYVRISSFVDWIKDKLGDDVKDVLFVTSQKNNGVNDNDSTTDSDVDQIFADGSDEAANPVADPSVILDGDGSSGGDDDGSDSGTGQGDDGTENGGNGSNVGNDSGANSTGNNGTGERNDMIAVPRVTFAIVCSVAAVAVIAFALLSVFSLRSVVMTAVRRKQNNNAGLNNSALDDIDHEDSGAGDDENMELSVVGDVVSVASLRDAFNEVGVDEYDVKKVPGSFGSGQSIVRFPGDDDVMLVGGSGGSVGNGRGRGRGIGRGRHVVESIIGMDGGGRSRSGSGSVDSEDGSLSGSLRTAFSSLQHAIWPAPTSTLDDDDNGVR